MRAFLGVLLLCASANAGDYVRVEGRVLDPTTLEGVSGAHVLIALVGRASILFPTAEDMIIVGPGETADVMAHCSGDTHTGADGAFHFDALVSGEYSIVAGESSRGIELQHLTVHPRGATRVDITLRPPRFVHLDLRGRTFDPSKHVLEFAPRVARPLGNVMMLPRLKLGEGWNFDAGPLPALDDWIVTGSELVLDNDYRATLFELFLHTDAPGNKRFEVDLSAGLELAGVVRGPAGEPLAGASVLASRFGRPITQLGAVTDAQGRYSIRGCVAGQYELTVARWRMRDAPGCGMGPIDALATRSIKLPLADGNSGNIKVESFEPALAIGTPAPDFTANQVDGTPLKLADLRGKVVLLDFWATWCGLCRADLPNLERFYPERAKTGRFEIVSISVDDDPALVQRFLASRKLPWRQIALGPVKVNPLAKLYNVWGTPATVLIDRDGKLAARDLLGDELRKKIDELLAAK